MKSHKTIIGFALAALLVGLKTNVGAEGDAFYQGKTIKVIVGFTSGGFYDRCATCPSICRAIRRWSCKTCPERGA